MGIRRLPIRLPASGIPADAPPINTVPAAQTAYVDTAKVFSNQGANAVSVGDVDTPIVTTILTATNGTIYVSEFQGVLVSNNGTAKVFIAGSPANVNRALNGMRVTPAAGFSGTATVTVRTSDGTNADQDSFNISVSGAAPAPQPQGPYNSVPSGTKTTGFQTTLDLSGDSISTFDQDTENLQTTLTVTHGIVNVSAEASTAVITGNGTATLVVAGPQVQVNAALATLTFQPEPAYSGPATITMATTDGALIDTDTINITVQPSPAALAPVITFGGLIEAPVVSQNSSPNTNMLLANNMGYNRQIQLSAAYKAPTQVTLSALHGRFGLSSWISGPSANIQADGYTQRVLYGYWNAGGSQSLANIGQDYSCIGLVHMRNSGTGQGNGSMSWPYPGRPTAAEVQLLRARGVKVYLVIGWANYGFNYTTRAQSTNLLNSIIPFINSLGGVDGIDFRNYLGDLTGLTLAPEAIYIVQQLRAIFGAGFHAVFTHQVIDAYTAQHRALAKALNDAGCLTFCQGLYIEWAGFKAQYACSDRAIQFSIATGIPGSKMLLSVTTNYDYANNLTTAETKRERDQCMAAIPSWRGLSVSNTELDALNNFQFYYDLRWQWQNRGGCTCTGNYTNNTVLSGDMTQLNASLWSFTYDPDDYYVGSDTITVRASDGVMSTTRTINVSLYYP